MIILFILTSHPMQACPEDALNPLSNELSFSLEGLPIPRQNDLKPILQPGIKNTSDYNVGTERL